MNSQSGQQTAEPGLISEELKAFGSSTPASSDFHQEERPQIEDQQRQAAVNLLDTSEIPTKRDEAWRYTNIAKVFGKDKLQVSDLHANFDREFFAEYLCAENYLVVVNGVISESLGSLKVSQQPPNKLTSLQQNSPGTETTCYFKTLNTALYRQHIAIDSADLDCTKLQIVFINSAGFSAPKLSFSLAESGKFNLIETYISTADSFVCPVTEYYLANNSRLDVVRTAACSDSKSGILLGNHHAELSAKAHFEHYNIVLSGKLNRNMITANLNQPGAYAELNGISLLSGSEHLDNQTVLDHRAPNCESHEEYKGVYADHSKGIFSGTIIVRPDAQKTNAVQSNQAILLSDTAKNVAQPQLKIWADDVKCTHGATCGQIDKDALFYLRSRGIDQLMAKKLLIIAFANSALRRLSDGELREYLQEFLDRKLKTLA